MKKFLSVILALAMAMSLSVSAFAADFKDTVDIPQSEAIDVIETLGIVNGYDNDVFGPNDILTRAQLCTILTRALYGDPIYTSTNQFKDVAPTHWANAYINTAYAYGLMTGYGNGYFGPEDKITYTQMAAVIMKALGYDCGKINWPIGINSMGHTLGLFDNVKFANYTDGCTRAHAAQMIYNAFELPFVNHKADYPVNIKGTSFLEDGLGFKEIAPKYVNGHLYTTYQSLTEKDKHGDYVIYITENASTYEKTIYPISATEYRLIDSKRAEIYSIDWAKVDLFVNGKDVNSNKWFGEAETAIGVFDDNDKLLAIYVETTGKDYVYQIMPDTTIYEAVKNDKNWNPDTSTVTYFDEAGDYVISNKVEFGWITKANQSYIYVDGVKIMLEGVAVRGSELNKGDYVKMFYNYRNEIVAIDIIADPYRYDITDKVYHTYECEHVVENVDCEIVTRDQVVSGTTFKPCSDCNANEGTVIIK